MVDEFSVDSIDSVGEFGHTHSLSLAHTHTHSLSLSLSLSLTQEPALPLSLPLSNTHTLAQVVDEFSVDSMDSVGEFGHIVEEEGAAALGPDDAVRVPREPLHFS